MKTGTLAAGTDLANKRVTGTVSAPAVSALQFVLTASDGTTTASAWATVFGVYTTGLLTAAPGTLSWNVAAGTFSATATVLGSQLDGVSGVCGTGSGGCRIYGFVWCHFTPPYNNGADGVCASMAGTSFPEGTSSASVAVSGAGYFSQGGTPFAMSGHADAILGGLVDGPKQAANPNYVGGIDTAEYAQALALLEGTSDPCLPLAALPDHAAGSSLSDEEIACEADLQSGLTLTQVLADIIRRYGPLAATAWLFSADQGSTQPLPPSETATIAAAMMAQQPASATALTPTAATTVADECERLVSAEWNAGSFTWSDTSKHPCQGGISIFVPGSDVPSVAAANLNAITAHLGYVKLSYRSAAAAPYSRTWYKSLAPCVGLPTGTSCHEYPYYASLQGGPPSPPTWLAAVPSTENSKEGTRYSTFLGAGGCKVQPEPVYEPFLVLPMTGSAAPPTTWICKTPGN